MSRTSALTPGFHVDESQRVRAEPLIRLDNALEQCVLFEVASLQTDFRLVLIDFLVSIVVLNVSFEHGVSTIQRTVLKRGEIDHYTETGVLVVEHRMTNNVQRSKGRLKLTDFDSVRFVAWHDVHLGSCKAFQVAEYGVTAEEILLC